MPFTLVYAIENTRQKTNQTHTHTTKTKHLNTTQRKQTTQNTAEQNYRGSVASYDTRPGNEVGLFYKAPEPTRRVVIHPDSSQSQQTDLTLLQ